jgi:S-adenosylmethionine:tRNA ribosyltransferase-isomerase
MQKSDFNFDLPRELIAQHPLPGRTDSRLMCMERTTGGIRHQVFSDLPKLLHPADLLVFNNTRVVPARLRASKETGGEVEILIERLESGTGCLAQLRVSRKPAPGSLLLLENGLKCRVRERRGQFFELHLETGDWESVMAEQGRLPLPPYIDRQADELDSERYQTVYASRPGAVAAPTAGLHFDQMMLDRLEAEDIRQAHVTLHVGAGTFQPVRSELVQDHRMHPEFIDVSREVVSAVKATKEHGGRVVAVGTTTVRSLETAAEGGQIRPFSGESELFIYPGYEFQVVDAMITNFHLPESTLLMMVSAFAGRIPVLNAYSQAASLGYRFFSYGDAMFIA